MVLGRREYEGSDVGGSAMTEKDDLVRQINRLDLQAMNAYRAGNFELEKEIRAKIEPLKAQAEGV
jgi:hypothetical protein